MMKRLILLLLFIACSANAWGAGTCVIDTTNADGTEVYKNEYTLLCTAHTDNSLAVTLTGTQMSYLDGRYILGITSYPGGTAPTDASDLAIVDSISRTLMDATDSNTGLDFIDATSTIKRYFWGPNGNEFTQAHVSKPWTITMTNNAVASAIVYLVLEVTTREGY
jgi:hypothetical protein